MSSMKRTKEPEITVEEKAAGLAAIERARQLRLELLEARGGKLFRNSVEDLDEIRRERSDALG